MKRVFAIVLGVLCAAALFGGALTYASGQPSSNVVYKYALLGDVYIPEDGLISATAPDGKTIPADTKEVTLDWAQGSYIFSYPNKTVNLKVYETAPADNVAVLGTVPRTVSCGLKTQFPGVTAETTISRTDGAPAIEPYSVDAVFWFNGKRVQTFRDISDSFLFTPSESGLWMLSYEYTDVFGETRTVDYPFTVTNDRIVEFSAKEQYFVGNTVSASDAYGFYNGKRYPVNLTAEAPDGTVLQITDSIILSQAGTYAVTASAEIEGETVAHTYTIEVKDGLQSFLNITEGFKPGEEALNHKNIEALSNTDKGLLLDMSSSTAGFTYNGVVDLNKLGKNTPVISFTPNHSYGGSIGKITVTLTDAYDPTNSVTVTYYRNSDMTATALSYDNTTVQASFGATSVAVSNYYPLNNSSVSWQSSFNTFWLSPSHDNPDKTYKAAESMQALNFAFDVSSNTVYSYGDYHLVGWEGKPAPKNYPTGIGWYPIADLDGDSLPNKFKGFTTGEVYVKLQVENGRGDVMIHSIGGISLANAADSYQTNSAILLGDFDGSLPAALGVAYQLPTVENPYITDVTCTVSLNGTQISVDGSSFTPAETGTYVVTYEGINQFGNQVSKTVELLCIEKPELTVSYETQAVKFGQVYTVGTPKVNGYGELSYTVSINGKNVQPGQKVKVQEEMAITVTARDALDSVEETYQLSVDRNVVTYDIDFPRSAVCGSSFAFPEAHIVDHLTGEALSYEIYVNGVKQADTMILPTEPQKITVEYKTARGSKSYTLAVRSNEILTGADALILPSGASAETDDDGTMVTVTANQPVVQLPYKLSATSLPVQIVVLEENLNFNTMTIRMTDGRGTCVTVSVKGLQEEDPHLYINGQDTLVSVVKQAQSIVSGENEGKIFYVYTLEYHDLYRAMLNSSKIIATVETSEDSLSFAGFEDGVYLDIYPENMQGSTATFGITQIGNQYFYASAFEYGDIVAPVLSTTDFFIGHNNVESGYVLKLRGLKAYDVLQSEAAVEVTVILPDGTVVCQNTDPAATEDIVLDGQGVYVLKIKATDAAGIKLDVTYRFTVEDNQGPQITVSGTVSETARKGDSLILPGASAKDASPATIRIAVFDPNGKITIFKGAADTVESVTLKNLKAGVYHIRYIAADEMDNVTTEVFVVTVEE